MSRFIRTHMIPVDDDDAAAFGIQHWPGYLSPFTRDQAPFALPNGTRVTKVLVDDQHDLAKVGEAGSVLGSLSHPTLGVAYFVEWDLRPRMPTLVVAAKIKVVV